MDAEILMAAHNGGSRATGATNDRYAARLAIARVSDPTTMRVSCDGATVGAIRSDPPVLWR